MLNDLDLCIDTANVLLKERRMEPITHDSYKALFSFPVKEYYEAIGFDFSEEDFSIPATQYIDLYNDRVKDCELHEAVIEVLDHFRQREIRQFVLSAMKQDMLNKTLKDNGIHHYFEGIMGLNDHYAASKIGRGKQLITEYNIDPCNATMIGDTIHDFEVAEQLGFNCILIADGHQSKERLLGTGVTVLNDLRELELIRD